MRLRCRVWRFSDRLLATAVFANAATGTAAGPGRSRDRTYFSTGTVAGSPRGLVCRQGGYSVMVCHGEPNIDDVDSLCQMLLDSCGGKFAAVDTYYIGTDGHAAFPATDWYNHGYRSILVFTDQHVEDSVTLGDSLAQFIQLGGGVVEAVFADFTTYEIAGAWRYQYAPFTVQYNSYSADSMGTVHQPLHPVMSGVSALMMGDYVTGNTDSTLRGPHSVCLAEYTTANRCVAASFDSAGQRAVSLGMFPPTYWFVSASGQWCRLMVNSLHWAAVGPSIGVTSPNGGESWDGGTVHDITWTQTANGVKDSIYYSTDAGSSWTGVTYFATPPAPLQYAWTVPNTPTTQARVKVVTWDSTGGRVEDASDSNFAIPATGIAQTRNGDLPTAFALYQPQPNPLVSGATISYALPHAAQVELRIYDVAGAVVRQLAGEAQTAGYHRVGWNRCDDRGRTVAPGVYFCRLTANDFLTTQKLVVRR